MQAHDARTQSTSAQIATTGARTAHTLAELRMALEDKARGQRIAALRKRKRLTQQVMAERLKIGYRTYQTWEAGSVMPEWPNLEKLAAFFGVKPEDIIGESPDLTALLGAENGTQPQLDRIEAALSELRTDLATTRDELAALGTGLTKQLRSLARKLNTAGPGRRSQPGG